MTTTVLFVDDDHRLIAIYAEAVADLGLEAKCISKVDGALKYLREGGRAEVIVWDMMMAPGQAFAGLDTQGGLATGRFLFRAMRELRPDAAFILLTNQTISTEVAADQPERRSYVRNKPETDPEALAQLIAELTGTSPDKEAE